MYPLNKHCKATVVETNLTKFVWESQHVNKVGKATDQIRVELQASDKVQAASWANLVSRVKAMNYSIFTYIYIYIYNKILCGSPASMQALHLLTKHTCLTMTMPDPQPHCAD